MVSWRLGVATRQKQVLNWVSRDKYLMIANGHPDIRIREDIDIIQIPSPLIIVRTTQHYKSQFLSQTDRVPIDIPGCVEHMRRTKIICGSRRSKGRQGILMVSNHHSILLIMNANDLFSERHPCPCEVTRTTRSKDTRHTKKDEHRKSAPK